MLTLSQILPHLIFEFKSEHDLIKAIEELSKKFTTNRENISDYLKDPRLTAAYTAFYLVTNFPKFDAVMKWMPLEWQELIRDCDFIDLGAGPGTFSLAYKEWSKSEGDFFQIETSATMREQAKKLWHGLYGNKDLHQSGGWSFKSEKTKLLLFGHSANEMGAEKAMGYIKEIEPHHVLFIEPGTKSFFAQMLKIRDYLIKEKYHVLYPCPSSLECPIKGSSDWCHQFIKVKQEPQIERISQIAKLDRKLLPLTVFAFSRAFISDNPRERILRVHPETKFSYEWDVCALNKIEHYQVMKKDHSKEEQKLMEKIMAGDAIQSTLEKDLQASKRVRIHQLKN